MSHIPQQNHVLFRDRQLHGVLSRSDAAGIVGASSNSAFGALKDNSGRASVIRQTSSHAVALQATPKLLTEFIEGKYKRAANWSEWYQRICKIIYQHWLIDEACPGKACMRVTVWTGRYIESRVLSFTPVADLTRDASKETAFRETALRAINSLSKTQVLDFPEGNERNKIVFDLDMTRSVNGPSGCTVAAFHN